MKARFTIIVATLLASSLFGDFFQDRNNRTPKGETGDLAETIGDLKAKISSLEGQVDDLNRLRARIKDLERQLADATGKTDESDDKTPVKPEERPQNPFLRDGPPRMPTAAEIRANMEELREKDPARYAQLTNNMARWQARRQERLQNKFDILASADTQHMTVAQRKVHEDYQKLLARQEELHELLNPNNANVTAAQREAAFKELRDISHQLHDLQRIERDTLLTQLANALGHKGDDAKEVVDAIKAIYEATGGGLRSGPPSGPGGRGGRGRR